MVIKGHTYLNKPAAFSFRFVLVPVTLLLPPDIKLELNREYADKKKQEKKTNLFKKLMK